MLDIIEAMYKEKYHNNLGEGRVKKGLCISHVDITQYRKCLNEKSFELKYSKFILHTRVL